MKPPKKVNHLYINRGSDSVELNSVMLLEQDDRSNSPRFITGGDWFFISMEKTELVVDHTFTIEGKKGEFKFVSVEQIDSDNHDATLNMMNSKGALVSARFGELKLSERFAKYPEKKEVGALYSMNTGSGFSNGDLIVLTEDDGTSSPRFSGADDWHYVNLGMVNKIEKGKRFMVKGFTKPCKYIGPSPEGVTSHEQNARVLMKLPDGSHFNIKVGSLTPIEEPETVGYAKVLNDLLQEQTEALVKKNERIAEIDEMIETLKEEKANLKKERKLNKKLIQGYEELLDNEQA